MAERLFYKFVAYKLLMHYNKMPTIPLFFCVKRKAPKESTLKGKGISSPFPLKYPFFLTTNVSDLGTSDFYFPNKICTWQNKSFNYFPFKNYHFFKLNFITYNAH